MNSAASKLILLGVYLSIFCHETVAEDLAAPGDALILLEGDEFELVCQDRARGIELIRMAERFGRAAVGIFRIDTGLQAVPARVVWIKSDSQLERPWTIAWVNSTQVELRLAYTSVDSDRSFYEGLAAAWLMREAYTVGRSDAVDQIPEWLISALALDFIQAENPAAHGAWSEVPDVREQTSLSKLVEKSYAEFSDSWVFACQSWKLFDGIISLSENREESIRVARSLMAGLDPRLFISRRVFESDSAANANAEIWWASEWDRYIWDPQQRARAIDMSRADLERLAYWSLMTESGDTWTNASAIMSETQDWSVELTAAVEKRINAIKWSFTQINPVYTNALHSLGLYYEALLLEKNEEAAMIWQRFAQDLRAGQEIWRAIRLDTEISDSLR